MKNIKLSIPYTPISLNLMLRMHWSKRKREQEKWDLFIFAQWMNNNRLIFFKPVKILYVLSFSAPRQRDIDNYIGGTKFITDSLRRSFLLKDDYKWLTGIEVRFLKGEEKTEIFIEEVDS